MRIRNQYSDPHCEKEIAIWYPSTPIDIVADGSHWQYVIPHNGSLIPQKQSDCLLMALTPADAWGKIRVENSTTLLTQDTLKVLDVSREKRNMVGIQASGGAIEITPTGMCFIDLDEWPILREVGATIFAADSAPY